MGDSFVELQVHFVPIVILFRRVADSLRAISDAAASLNLHH
jgi:hypothetical protein